MGYIKFFTTNNNGGWKHKERGMIKRFPEIHEEIINFIRQNNNLDNLPFKQKVWHFIHNVTEIVLCEECNENVIKFINIKKGYRRFCGNRCAAINKDVREIRENTMIENYGKPHSWSGVHGERSCDITIKSKYGVDNVSKLGWVKEKAKQTNLKNLGVEFPSQSEEVRDKIEKTWIETYGVGNPMQNKEVQEKRKKIFMETLGCETPFHSPEIQEMLQQTKIELYGDPYYNNQEKHKQTCMNRYGVDSTNKLPEKIRKILESTTGMSLEEYIESLPEFKLYKIEVDKVTRKQPLYLLKNIEKRELRDYWLDHMFSICEGFRQGINPEIIGNICNLEMIPWKDNISKNKKCSITKRKLFEMFKD